MAKQSEVAKHLGLSVTRVSQLVKAGILPKSARGQHDVDASRTAYLAHLRAVAAGRGSRDGTGLDLVVERARLAAAQAARVERQNAVEAGEFLPRSEVHTAVTASFRRVRSKLLAMPARLAPVLAPAMSPAQAQRILKATIYEALNELASTRVTGISDTGDLVFTETQMEREQ